MPLTDWPVGRRAHIVRIEDDVPTILTQILAEGLFPGTVVEVIEGNGRGLHLRAGDQECWLAPILAANVAVEAAPEPRRAIRVERLSALKPGEAGKVVTLTCRGLTRRRFLDLGLVPGTRIEAVMRAALGKPTAYRVRGTLLAFREEQADQVMIEREEGVASTPASQAEAP